MKKQAKTTKKDFFLNDCPIDMVISIHMRNMMATYGEQKVRNTLKELFDVDTGILANEEKLKKVSSK